MKRFRIVVVALAIGLGAMAHSSFASTSKHHKLGKAELKSLIESASTPDQHMRLAEYYTAEAQRYSDEAAEHQEQAELYKKNPILSSPKFVTGTIDHCDSIAKGLSESAAQARELAEMHKHMATDSK